MALQSVICGIFQLGLACNTMALDKLLIEYILVPSVITIIFIYVATNMFTRNLSLKINSVVSIMFYIVFVYSGIYGIIAPVMYNSIELFLIGALVLFFLTRVIAPTRMEDLGRGAMKLGERSYDRKVIHDRIHVKEKELDSLKDMINELKEKGLLEDKDLSIIEMLMHETRIEMNILKDQLKRSKHITPILNKSDEELVKSRFESIESKQETIEDILRKDERDYRNRLFFMQDDPKH
ncbi:MAG: hypothetical protein ACP5E4_03490 [Candidatus Aenigmatarchaeota archaeon]